MRALLAIVASALTLVGCGGSEKPAAPPPAPAKPAPSDAVLAVWSDASGSELFWANGRTMEPVNRRSYPIPFVHGAAERSPDGAMLAVGGGETGVVDVVDLKRMRSLGEIELAPGAWVDRLHWAQPDRILAVLWGERPRVAAFQPGARKPIAVHELEGMVVQSRPAGGGLALLLAPSDRIGQARLAVFDGEEVRYADLPGVRAGWNSSGEEYGTQQLIPALAVDPAGSRAVVFSPGNRVTEVDLASLSVSSHDLVQAASLLERFRNWLEPEAWAKLVDGPELNAVWLPSGLIALSGVRYAIDGNEVNAMPAGLAFVDPGNWSVKHISDAPSWVTFRGGALLGSAWNEQSGAQSVHVFGPDGTPRFEIERRGQADLSQTAGEHLYVSTQDGRKFEIVDLATGQTVGRAAPERPAYIVYTE